jgi:hypothetical protein
MTAKIRKEIRTELKKALADWNAGTKLQRRCLRRLRRAVKLKESAHAKRPRLKIA